MMHKNNDQIMTFDQDLAAEYIGKYILIGITNVDASGEIYNRQEMHGVITSISSKGVEVDLKGLCEGQSWKMPPALNCIQKADPGVYNLKSTGESVEDPDLLITWTITTPPEPGEKFSKEQMEGIELAQSDNKVRFDNKPTDE